MCESLLCDPHLTRTFEPTSHMYHSFLPRPVGPAPSAQYDVRHPETRGTCSPLLIETTATDFSNVTLYNTTTNSSWVETNGNRTETITTSYVSKSVASDSTLVTGNATTMSNFPEKSLPLVEQLLLAAVCSLLTIPLALLCFTCLIKLAMSKKNERLWERFGTQDLGGNLLTRRRLVKTGNGKKRKKQIVGVTSCGSCAFVHVRSSDEKAGGSQAGRALVRASGFGSLATTNPAAGMRTRWFTLTSRTEIVLVEEGEQFGRKDTGGAGAASNGGMKRHSRMSAVDIKTGAVSNPAMARTKSGFLCMTEDQEKRQIEETLRQAGTAFAIRLSDPIQGRFAMPCADASAAQELLKLLRSVIARLPLEPVALKAAKSAAEGRSRHIFKFGQKYDVPPEQGKTGNHNLRNEEDRVTLRKLQELCEGLEQHAVHQQRIVTTLIERDAAHRSRETASHTGGDNSEGNDEDDNDYLRPASSHGTAASNLDVLRAASRDFGGEEKLFRLKASRFMRKIRSRLLSAREQTQEAEEDAAYRHLKSCCCRMLFRSTVHSTRHQIEERMRRQKKWAVYLFMAMYAILCAVYVTLFGFCHGQSVTLAWMQSLLLQLVMSAVLVRPASILVMSAIAPTIAIETGLAALRADRARKSVYNSASAPALPPSTALSIDLAQGSTGGGGVEMVANPMGGAQMDDGAGQERLISEVELEV